MAMLDSNDLKQIGTLMDEKFVGFEKKVDEKFSALGKDIDGKFVAFEDRLVDRIVGDIGEVLEQNFLPMVGHITAPCRDPG